jgi:hypothetical protein
MRTLTLNNSLIVDAAATRMHVAMTASFPERRLPMSFTPGACDSA